MYSNHLTTEQTERQKIRKKLQLRKLLLNKWHCNAADVLAKFKIEIMKKASLPLKITIFNVINLLNPPLNHHHSS